MALGFFKKKKDASDPASAAGGASGAGGQGGSGGGDEETPSGSIKPEPDKARRFFDRAQTVHDTHNFEYAMTLWLQGLRFDPTSVSGLESFMKSGAEFSAQPKVKGPSKDQVTAFPGKGPLEKYLRTLLEWGARPLEWQYGLRAMEAAAKLGLDEPAYWIGERTLGIAGQDPKKKKDTFVTLMNLFAQVGGFDKAVLAGEIACRIDPTDAPLQTQVRNMSAQSAMSRGGYDQTGQAGGFRANVRNLDEQRAREEEDRLVKSEDVQARAIERAKADYASRPTDDNAIQKLARVLMERGLPEDEKLAYQVLMEGYKTNQNYRFKQMAGDIMLRVGRRKLRELRAELEKDPDNAEKRERVAKAERRLLTEEIREYEERVAAYPTDLSLRLELGRRCLDAGEYEKAIEHFQIARNAPQLLERVLLGLARAFERLEWLDEAESTYREAIEKHENANDDMGVELRYGLMVVLEKKARDQKSLPLAEEAFRLAASIAVQRISFRDIRERRGAIQDLVKSLRE